MEQSKGPMMSWRHPSYGNFVWNDPSATAAAAAPAVASDYVVVIILRQLWWGLYDDYLWSGGTEERASEG